MDLQELVRITAVKAKEILKNDGYHNPMIISFRDNKGSVIPIPSWNNNTKEIIFRNLTNTLKKLKVDVFIYVFESWMVTKKDNEELDINILPSKHPDRIDTLCIIGKTKADMYGIVIPFTMLGKRIIFEKEEIFNSNEGFSMEDNLFKDVFDEKGGE